MGQAPTEPLPPPPGAAAPPASADAPPTPWWLVPARIGSGLVALLVVLLVALATLGALAEESTAARSQTVTEAVDRVRVVTDTGRVRVTVGAAGQPALVTTRQRESFRRTDVAVRVVGGTLEVEGRCDGGWGWLGVGRCDVEVDVRVPAGVPVEATADTGDVEVLGPAAAVVAATDTGRVVVRGATGRLELRSDTGDVDASRLGAGPVQARTDTGTVELGFTVPPAGVEARTDTGDVRVSVPPDGTAYRVDASTDTGETRVEVAESPTSTRRIDAATDTGDIRVSPDVSAPAPR